MTKRIHLLHTNDIHSFFARMPQVTSCLRRLRKEWTSEQDACITVDVGDHLDRSHVITEGSAGLANKKVLKHAQYEVITLGNNELLTLSKEDLYSLYEKVPYDVVGTNVSEMEGTPRPSWLLRSSIQTRLGVKVGFLGVTIPYQPFYHLLGWNVEEPFLMLPAYVNQLRPEVDVLVLLSHLGLPHDRRIAAEIEGIDLILGAHTHHLLEEPEKLNQTWIAAAGKFAEHIGHTVIEVGATTHTLLSITGTCYASEAEEADKETVRIIEAEKKSAEENLSSPLVQLNQRLTIDWYNESPLGNLLADGLRRWIGAELALVNAGQVLDHLEQGKITRKRIHEICPHPINPCMTVLTGKQIRETLEESLLLEFQEKKIKGFGFRGKRLGMLNVSGIDVYYHPEKPPSQKISHICLGNDTLKDEKMYRVATIDMFTFGIGYLKLKEGKKVDYELPEFLRDVLSDALQNPKEIEESYKQRWRVVSKDE
ncbi:bifunctional UDP-sugar hydrolase/5'-nucleotidase [Mechercharimyces sp. CAU 1602]|uniref:bifunctional metallophosphatase/5'-nucleotidase n=1 Tax=Mechercharimyces sp. CAU 1602 TaxID=2973933 RepID=UPI0021623899|nr:bifunctional UDP-sugar hydrolase/5'-nucleotidase [Mechercharimyces sp. CAU 1602]MCS1351833.1 bifunctional metallophosphatase/5'-nucleotidase [Mechercharimyces sp. CAU 1602]